MKKRSADPIRTPSNSIPARVRNWLMVSQRRQIGVAAATIMTFGLCTFVSLTMMMGDSGEPDAATVAAVPATPLAASSTATAPKASTPYPTIVPPSVPLHSNATGEGNDGPQAGDDAAAQAVGLQFANAWLSGRTAASQEAWVAGMRPVTSAQLLAMFRMTDRRTIPQATIVTADTASGFGVMNTRVQLSNGMAIRLSYARDGAGRWSVDSVDPA